jgi:hypothetical protein
MLGRARRRFRLSSSVKLQAKKLRIMHFAKHAISAKFTRQITIAINKNNKDRAVRHFLKFLSPEKRAELQDKLDRRRDGDNREPSRRGLPQLETNRNSVRGSFLRKLSVDELSLADTGQYRVIRKRRKKSYNPYDSN